MSRRWCGEKHSRIRGKPARDGLSKFCSQLWCTLPCGRFHLYNFFRMTGIWILSTTSSTQNRPVAHGSDLEKMRIFQKTIEFGVAMLGKYVHMYFFMIFNVCVVCIGALFVAWGRFWRKWRFSNGQVHIALVIFCAVAILTKNANYCQSMKFNLPVWFSRLSFWGRS